MDSCVKKKYHNSYPKAEYIIPEATMNSVHNKDPLSTQFSLGVKPIPHMQFKSSLRGLNTSRNIIDDTKRQPKSILPLNMLVSDIAYRVGRVPVNFSSDSLGQDDSHASCSEIHQLLKIKNKKKKLKTSKCDKFLTMAQEKRAKMYSSNSPHSSKEQQINTEDNLLFRQNMILDKKENVTPNTTSKLLTTPLRQQCKNFSQLYGKQYFENDETKPTDSLELPISYGDMRNEKRNTNSLEQGLQCTMYDSFNSESDSPLNDALSPTFLKNVGYPEFVNYEQNLSVKHKEFIFKPVLGKQVRFKSFDEMVRDLDNFDEESIIERSSGNTRQAPPVDTLVKETTVEKELTFTIISESSKMKINYPQQFVASEE